MNSIRSIVILMSAIISIAILIGFYTITSYFFNSIAYRQSEQISTVVSQLTFNSMYQVMKQGWSRQEMNDFMEATKDASRSDMMEVSIFRGQVVENLFGRVAQDTSDPIVSSALSTGKQCSKRLGAVMLHVQPIMAKQECLACHINAKEGDVLGVITVRQNLSTIEEATRKSYYWMLLALAPLPLLLGYFTTRYLLRRIDKSIGGIEQAIDEIVRVRDLVHIDFNGKEGCVKEVQRIFDKIKELTHKIKDIAADKDLLEFEVKLLDKFIITSDVVRDWREHIKDLLLEINCVMEAYSLFVIFKIEDESYELEIFWRHTPHESTVKLFEASIDRRVRENPYFGNETTFAVRHHVADNGKCIPKLTAEDIELQTKSLLLSVPKLGGVVGIGVQSLVNKDPMRHIVIESILTTLVNVVGSIKAIYKYTQDLEYYSTRDPLTNLFNQRAFREMLSHEMARAGRQRGKFSLLMIDCDNFKLVNDRYGHSFGDEYLKGFSQHVKNSLRAEDIFARYGGDEFAIILPEADNEKAVGMASKIREIVESFMIVSPDEMPIKATISVGVATFPDHGQNENDLFLIADTMMYRAKQNGKNAIYSPSDHDIIEAFREEQQKAKLVMDALEFKKLVPYVQPIMNLSDGTIRIHELLMRIQNSHGVVMACEFIETAERIGVVHKMDYILLEKMFEKIRDVGYEDIIFVNLSPRALIIGEFISNIKALAVNYGISPSRIVLEITERDTVKNIALLEKFVHDLKIEGFKFAIDDFGSGFSSFHYVKHFPIDYIKIEGEFIRNMVNDRVYLAFVKSIVTLAKELEIKTVAEYIEDEETLAMVRELGIDYAQGYLIGRPQSEFIM